MNLQMKLDQAPLIIEAAVNHGYSPGIGAMMQEWAVDIRPVNPELADRLAEFKLEGGKLDA